jgi:hypothetical protein
MKGVGDEEVRYVVAAAAVVVVVADENGILIKVRASIYWISGRVCHRRGVSPIIVL